MGKLYLLPFLFWYSLVHCQCQLLTVPVWVSNTSVQRVSTVRNLGVHLHADVSMCAHVTAIVRACFASLRQILSVRHCLPCAALVTLIHALILSKLDYLSSVLAESESFCGIILRQSWNQQQGSFLKQENMSMSHHFSVGYIGSKFQKE